jgi:microcystin-dependent protein|tara:strand:+ start:833 stop:1480 length:648 start_codon:yes stop_codon:yes gene_type:complete
MSNYEATKYDFSGASLTGIEGTATGTILPWSTGSAPSGFLECAGAAVSRTTYATLFGVISTTYGTGDGSTTFNLPDLQNNVAVGKSPAKALASTGGANTVSATGNVPGNVPGNVTGNIGGNVANTSLSTAQLAAHTHTVGPAGPGQNQGGSNGMRAETTPSGAVTTSSTGSGSAHDHNLSATFSGASNFTLSANFSGTASSVLQPYLTLMYVIKT